MTGPESAARWGAALVSRAGGYLRNPVHSDRVTCAVCTTPVDGYRRCIPCSRQHSIPGLADAVAFLTYAVASQQSGYVTRGYKAPKPPQEHRAIVALVLLAALSRHGLCPDALAGTAVTHWAHRSFSAGQARRASVPRDRQQDRTLARDAARRCGQRAAPPGHQPGALPYPRPTATGLARAVTGRHLGDRRPRPVSRAWAACRGRGTRFAAGGCPAGVKTDFGDNAAFFRSLADRDYDPEVCPGGDCP